MREYRLGNGLRKKREAIASLYPKGKEVLIIDGISSYYVPTVPLISISVKYIASPPDYFTVLHHEFAHHLYRKFMTEIFPLINQYKGRNALHLLLNVLEDCFIERNHPYVSLRRFVEHAHRSTQENEPIQLSFPNYILVWHYDLRKFYPNAPDHYLDSIYETSEAIYHRYEELRLMFEKGVIDAKPIVDYLLNYIKDEGKEKLSEGHDTTPLQIPNPNPFFGNIQPREYITSTEYYLMTKRDRKAVLQRGFSIKDEGRSNITIKEVNNDNSYGNGKAMERYYGYGLKVDYKRTLKWKRKIAQGSNPTTHESPLYRRREVSKPNKKLVLLIDTSSSMYDYRKKVNELLENLPADIVIEFNGKFFLYQAPKGKKILANVERTAGDTNFPDIQLPDADRYTFVVITDGDVSNTNDMTDFKGRHKTVFVIPRKIVEHFPSFVPHITPYITLEEAIRNPQKLKELLS